MRAPLLGQELGPLLHPQVAPGCDFKGWCSPGLAAGAAIRRETYPPRKRRIQVAENPKAKD